MARTFLPPPGATYPATVADFRKAKSGDVAKARMVSAEHGKAIAAPYPEVIPSWLSNGWKEVPEEVS